MKFSLIYFIIILGFYPLLSQALPQNLKQKLDNVLMESQVKSGVKSLSASMHFGNYSNWSKAYGISSISPRDSVKSHYSYLIGSVTKMITCSYIMKLHEQNLLNINDPIGKYLDSITHVNSHITIQQLLNHTSGLYDVLANPTHQQSLLFNVLKRWDASELVNQFLKEPKYAAGQRWDYCNTNYFLLGMIIQKLTGSKFYNVYRQELFDPYQLSSIKIPAYETMTTPIAHVWMDLNGDNQTEDGHNFYMQYVSLNSSVGAAGGYFSTASDISQWTWRYLRGDLLRNSTMDIIKSTFSASGAQGGKYGLGLMENNFHGYKAFGHGGDLAYAASSWYFPELDVSISVMNNDAKFNSWTLLPIVSELIKIYSEWKSTPTSDLYDSKISIFPNPANNILFFQQEDDIEKIEVSNIYGDLIYSSNDLISQQSIDISCFSAGVYNIRFYSDQKVVSKLFSKI